MCDRSRRQLSPIVVTASKAIAFWQWLKLLSAFDSMSAKPFRATRQESNEQESDARLLVHSFVHDVLQIWTNGCWLKWERWFSRRSVGISSECCVPLICDEPERAREREQERVGKISPNVFRISRRARSHTSTHFCTHTNTERTCRGTCLGCVFGSVFMCVCKIHPIAMCVSTSPRKCRTKARWIFIFVIACLANATFVG